jgi:serine/threonine-protein phosphatase 2A regulatory subunit B''
MEEFNLVTTTVCGLPKYFNTHFFSRIDVEKTGKISRAQFVKYFSENFQKLSINKRFFNIIKKEETNYIEPDDLKVFLRGI